MKDKIRELAAQYFEEAVAIRRHLHMHPELSYEEYETQAFISQKLTEWGIPHRTVAQTGVLAQIRSDNNPDKAATAIWSDHDALPIDEKNNQPYKSTRPGKQHACGHDAHTACNLLATRILYELRSEFEGTVNCLFQPGEEYVKSDGTTGAQLMIDDGALSNPTPRSIVAQHVNPSVPCGKIALKSGKTMASVDTIKIKVCGTGGHAASPHLGTDPLPIAGLLQQALQLIASRYNNPVNPMVLSISSIHSDSTAFNVLSSEINLLGTLRAYNENWRKEVHRHITRMCQGIAAAFDTRIDCRIEVGIPFLQNDAPLTERVQQAAIDYLGAENVLPIDAYMTGEDFAVYSQQMPACFYWLGVRNEERGITSGLHTDTMDIDENALKTGAGLLAWLAVSELD